MHSEAKKDSKIKVPRFEIEFGFKASKKSSRLMSKIHSKDTKPEIKLRKALWNRGYRYRLRSNYLTGKPDVVFQQKKVLIFIDGDFWHGRNWVKKKEMLTVNNRYWIPKIERNMQRDEEVSKKLKKQGWIVLRFWEYEINKDLEGCLEIISKALD